MEEQIKQLVEKSIALIDKTGQFIESELPLVVQEFLTYKSIEHLAGSFLFLVPLIVLYIWYRLMPDEGEKDSWNIKIFSKFVDEPHALVYIIVSFLFSLTFLFFSVLNFLKFLKITIAPRVYLIDYFLN